MNDSPYFDNSRNSGSIVSDDIQVSSRPGGEFLEVLKKHTIWCANGEQKCVLPNGRLIDLDKVNWSGENNTELSDLRNTIQELQQDNIILQSLVYSPSDQMLRLFKNVPTNIQSEVRNFYFKFYNVAQNFIEKYNNIPKLKGNQKLSVELFLSQEPITEKISDEMMKIMEKLSPYKIHHNNQVLFYAFVLGNNAKKILPIINEYSKLLNTLYILNKNFNKK